MTTNTCKPGRPRGSGINDNRDLDAVADLLVCEPELKKTPAISRVVQKRHSDHQHQWPAVERRLLRKWNQTAEERLATAQERKEERRNRTTYRSAPHHASSSSMSCLAAIGVGSAFQRALEEERNSWLMNGRVPQAKGGDDPGARIASPRQRSDPQRPAVTDHPG